MLVEIVVPKIGMSTKPLTIVEWKTKESEWVEKGNVVLIVETEKITYGIEAEISGYLHILVEEKKEVPIGSVMGIICELKEEYEKIKYKKLEMQEKESSNEISGINETAKNLQHKESQEKQRIKISPLAKKLAEEHMIDVTKIKGTGPSGRIVKKDIEQAIEDSINEYDGRKIKEELPLVGMRKIIAEHMHKSLSVSAQLTVMGEIDAYELVGLRNKLLKKEKDLGTRITYTDIIIYIVSRVLKEFPLVNASLINNTINMWEDINVGIAVALEDGLIVPVIKNADKKSLITISKELKDLSKKAKEKKLNISDVEGGTFTITNLGAYGGGYRFETVIINQPESAILGTGGITDRPVVINKEIVIRPIMTYYLTYDHRSIDGALAVRFMAKVKENCENALSFVKESA